VGHEERADEADQQRQHRDARRGGHGAADGRRHIVRDTQRINLQIAAGSVHGGIANEIHDVEARERDLTVQIGGKLEIAQVHTFNVGGDGAEKVFAVARGLDLHNRAHVRHPRSALIIFTRNLQARRVLAIERFVGLVEVKRELKREGREARGGACGRSRIAVSRGREADVRIVFEGDGGDLRRCDGLGRRERR